MQGGTYHTVSAMTRLLATAVQLAVRRRSAFNSKKLHTPSGDIRGRISVAGKLFSSQLDNHYGAGRCVIIHIPAWNDRPHKDPASWLVRDLHLPRFSRNAEGMNIRVDRHSAEMFVILITVTGFALWSSLASGRVRVRTSRVGIDLVWAPGSTYVLDLLPSLQDSGFA